MFRSKRYFIFPAIVLSSVMYAHAAPVLLGDAPALDVVTVKPNIMFTLDTSGSMQELAVPDAMTNNVGLFCFRNHIANPLYFNPGVVANGALWPFAAAPIYEPPRHYNAATNTVTILPDVAYVAAPWDGFNTGATYRDDFVTNGTLANRTAPLDLRTRFRHDYEYSSTFGPGLNTEGSGHYYRYRATNAVAPTPGVCHADAAYERVDVSLAPADVQQNFANWFSYYRSRMQAMKTAAGIAFSNLDNGFRVGFHNIHNTAGSFLNVLDFDSAHRQTWYDRFYVSVPANATPTRAATARIGEYFRSPATSGLAGAIDPIQFSCQGNFHIVSTDGYWNETTNVGPGNTDDTIVNNAATLPSAIPGFTKGAAWPPLYRQSTAALAGTAINTNTMSDIATHYWATDLRGLPNNVPRSGGSLTDSQGDPANWQHVVLFGVSIAARGTLPYDKPRKPSNVKINATLTTHEAVLASFTTETERTLYRIEHGLSNWPTVGTAPSNVPWPTGVARWPHPTNNTPSAIDDLWHATVNARGNFFNVNSAQELGTALYEALSDIASRSATAAGAGLADANLGAASDNAAYVPGYLSGKWTGELSAKLLDPATGKVLTTTNALTGQQEEVVRWRHAAILDAQVQAGGSGLGWDTNRKILTASAGSAVPFRFASLSTAQKGALGATATEQAAVLRYLRGERTNEDQNAAGSLRFRQRDTLLGDIVTSEPRAVAVPFEKYSDNYNPKYAAFKTTHATRKPMVYFGANDGFIHAVNGETAAGAPNAGKEMFAYMPSQLLRTDASGIAALRFKPIDPLPNRFQHRFYVDGLAFHRDVDFSRTTQNPASPTPVPLSGVEPDWRTVYITGLGKGGTSYVALDITTAPTGTETEADFITTKKLLWEFTDPDMGFSYGKAAIVKTARYGWVALLPSGYNNITGPNAGKGIVFVVDIKTGTLLHKFITPTGSASDPIGMAHLDAFVPDITDYSASDIYAGDLFGNLWRFDISSNLPYAASGVKFAELRNAANQIQPITANPVPYVDPLSGKRYVGVGTGKLLAAADLTDLTRHALYNIHDGDAYTPKSVGLPITRADLDAVVRTTDKPNLPVSSKGWYQDMRPDGERIVKEILAQFGVIIAISIAPSTDPCNRGGVGTAYARSAATANNLITGGTPWVGGSASDVPIVGARAISTSNGKPVVQIVGGDGKIDSISSLTFPGGFKGTVVNYREFID